MTIKKMVIKDFKSIVNQTIDLGNLNVFIGTNGAGKSNILEAIAMLSSALDEELGNTSIHKRGARLSSPEIYKSSFRNIDRKNHFSLSVETESYKYSTGIYAKDRLTFHSEKLTNHNNESLAGRSNRLLKIKGLPDIDKLTGKFSSEGKFPKTKSLASLYKILFDETGELESIANFAIYAPSTPILRGVAVDDSVLEPLGLYGGKLAKALKTCLNNKESREGLKEFFEFFDWMKSVSTTANIKPELLSELGKVGSQVLVFTDHFMKTNFNKLYAYDVSEGALYIIFVLVLLHHKNSPNIFALDNVDNALNPGLVRVLTQALSESTKNSNKQIFLTTHNPATLDSIDLFDKNHRLFVVSRSSSGQTEINRIEPPPKMTKDDWEEKYFGMSLSDIWLSGSIGGLPTGFKE